MTVIPNTIGIASGVEVSDRSPVPQLFAGDTPAVMTKDILLPGTGTILQYTPLDATGAPWAATASPVTPIASMTTYDSTRGTRAGVYKAGCFNIDAIRWPAGTTEAQIEAATATGNMQFRKLLWSDRRIDTVGQLPPGTEAGGFAA